MSEQRAEISDAPVALVTGAAQRLGAEMARSLAARGFHVVIHYHHSVRAATALVAELRATGARADLVQGALQSKAGAEAVFDATRDLAGPVALLVNNASNFHNDDLSSATEAHLADHMAVNLAAPLWLMARMAAQPDLPANALVVNMLDNKLFALNPDFFTYTLSKSALKTATEMAAQYFKGRPRVCGIAPSITLRSGAQSEADFERSARINPLRRRVQPQDLCAALWLLWQEPALDGQILVVDAGQRAWQLPRDVAFLEPSEIPHG